MSMVDIKYTGYRLSDMIGHHTEPSAFKSDKTGAVKVN